MGRKKKEEIVETLKDEYILLCLDASYKCTGWSLIKVSNRKPYNILNKYCEVLEYGSIPTNGKDIGRSLLDINNVLEGLFNKYYIDYITAEESFISTNRLTGIRLGNVHGVLQLIAAKHSKKIVYYSVMTMKSKTLNGIKLKKEDGSKKTGEELKIEVSNKVKEIFKNTSNLGSEITLDETDSISAGVTFILMDGQEVKKEKKAKKKSKNNE